MDGVINLEATVQRMVEEYATPAIQANTYAISDVVRKVFTVVVVPTDFPREYFDAGIVVLARIADNHIIIDEDATDRPLWKELVRAGIPREQIILTYAGETIPESMQK